METEYRYLLHLLGAYLRQETPEIREDADWKQLIRLSQIHNVAGILGYMGKKYPICSEEQTKALLRGLCHNTIGVYARRNAQADALAAELEQAGIDHILMKGYVLRDFYPVADLRTFNDIDLVIRPEDRKKCDERMLALGFQRHTDWEPVYSYVRGSEFYEIHTQIMEIDVSDRADYQGYFRNLWEHAKPVRDHSYRFTPEFHFLYLLTHIAKHVYGSGAGIRMYLDVAAFLRHYGETVNWRWIREQLEVLKLEQFADTVVSAVESWFGVRSPMEHGTAEMSVLEDLLLFTMEAGTFGHYQRDGALASLKHEDPEEEGSRARKVLEKTFPKAKTIEKRYTYLQRNPWLLPVAWVHRLVKNREKLGQRTREMEQIIRIDAEEVRKQQKLMRDIGL